METKRKKGAPPRYDEAFKAGAIRMVTEQGRPSTEGARELGICIDTLRNWLKSPLGCRLVSGIVRIGTVVGYGSWRRWCAPCASRCLRRMR